jgi:hypothetical protein
MIRQHGCINVEGFLRNARWPRDFRVFTHDDGRPMDEHDAMKELAAHRAAGHRVIPIGNCDNFDFQTGCRGHRVPEPA